MTATPDGPGLLLTYEEAAAILGSGVGTNTIRGLIQSGELIAVKVGRRFRRIPRASVERYVRNLELRAYGLPLERPAAAVVQARRELGLVSVLDEPVSTLDGYVA
jgi:excisionase family DNA binding protein